jgi:hypothetical protein
MRKSPAMRQSLHQTNTFHYFLPNLLPTKMSSNAVHEESKIQDAITPLQKHPKMKASEAARKRRVSCSRLLRRLKVFHLPTLVEATPTQQSDQETTVEFDSHIHDNPSNH